jgi:hypothetical protein
MIPREKLDRIYAIIDRISDEEFQRSVWGGIGVNTYHTYVISCLEAIEMLGDENFYKIVESQWDKTGLSEDLHTLMQDFVQKIDNFKEDELPYKELALNEGWITIVNLAKQIKKQMVKELNIDAENPPIW